MYLLSIYKEISVKFFPLHPLLWVGSADFVKHVQLFHILKSITPINTNIHVSLKRYYQRDSTPLVSVTTMQELHSTVKLKIEFFFH